MSKSEYNKKNPLCLYLKYNMISIFKPQPELILVLLLQRLASELVNLLLEVQNMEVCYILVTTFSIFFASSISLIFSNLFEFCEPYMLGNTAV